MAIKLKPHVILLLLFPLSVSAQKTMTLGGMNMSYEIIGKEVEIELTAPTKGWVGIGFNKQNSIVKSDLYLLRVKEDKIEGLDMYVIGVSNPKEDVELGGSNDLHLIDGHESSHSTTLKFRLQLEPHDSYDYAHKIDHDFWLILAYSQSDDFDHHSTMRRHTLFNFTK